MPIIKFTLDYPRTKSFYTIKKGYGDADLMYGMNEAKRMGERLTKIHGILTYLKVYPDTPIETAIGMFLDDKVQITKKGKNHTQYWIPNLYIHVEN